MISVNGHDVDFNDTSVVFSHAIAKIIEDGTKVYILLDIPNDDYDTLNNVYCYSNMGNLLWQVQDLEARFPQMKHKLSYLSIKLHGNQLWLNDFAGRRFIINVNDGVIMDMQVAK